MWAVFLLGGGAAAVFAGLLVVLGAGSDTEPSSASRTSSVAPVVSVSASASANRSPLSVLDRAALGEAAALEQIAARPEAERNVEESLALARGREQQHRQALAALRTRLGSSPDAAALLELRRFIDDPRSTVDALAIAAGLPGPAGPDLLFLIWTGTSGKTEATRLAEELLFNPTLRGRASPALAVALDLRRSEDCDVVKAILPRAIADGDQRSLRPLGKLLGKRGCGPRKTEDCFRCLREGKGKELNDAIAAVKRRPAP
jgi:hypothetical protein